MNVKRNAGRGGAESGEETASIQSMAEDATQSSCRHGRDFSTTTADPIGAGLRRLLSSVSDEPIPDDFMRLLEQLDDKRASARSAPGETDRQEQE